MLARTVAAAALDKKSNFEFQLEDEIVLFYFLLLLKKWRKFCAAMAISSECETSESHLSPEIAFQIVHTVPLYLLTLCRRSGADGNV